MNLPPDFLQTIRNTFGTGGTAWLSALPDLIEAASRRWNLTDIQPVPDLSYNFVAFAHRLPSPLENGDGGEGEVVLKIGVPNNELRSGIAALRCFDGRGACRLLAADPGEGMLLLERLQPGRMASTLEDDEEATHIAADVMSQLWRPVPENRGDFIQLRDWFDGFRRLRDRFDGGTGPLPEVLVGTAESLSRDLLAENKDEALLHGDFHHYNLLTSERGWLAIDPKGVIGPRGYEVGPLLINPNERFLSGSDPRAQTTSRVTILSERLGMGWERIRAWGLSHCVLSACWSLEDKGDWTYAIRCAEIIMAA